jgi:hypothetical protein
MDFMNWACSFASAATISIFAVGLFAAPIDAILARAVPVGPAARRAGVRLAVFVLAWTGGRRLSYWAALVMPRASVVPAGAVRILFEALRALVGSMVAVSGMLFVFYFATLTAFAALSAYQRGRRTAPRTSRI